LINGITSSTNSSDASKFLYFNIFPKLHVHRLSDNEKVTGSSYRRSFINKNGLEFLSKLDKMYLERKPKNIPAAELSTESKMQKDAGDNGAQVDRKVGQSKIRPKSPPKGGRAK